MTPARSQTRSFTLIELIVVTVITVILAALSVPVLANGSARRLSRAAHELAMHIKLARDLAVATRPTRTASTSKTQTLRAARTASLRRTPSPETIST